MLGVLATLAMLATQAGCETPATSDKCDVSCTKELEGREETCELQPRKCLQNKRLVTLGALAMPVMLATQGEKPFLRSRLRLQGRRRARCWWHDRARRPRENLRAATSNSQGFPTAFSAKQAAGDAGVVGKKLPKASEPG